MDKRYRYRHTLELQDVLALNRAQRYDALYQVTPWTPGLAWPMMAREEGVSRLAMSTLTARADSTIAVIMLRVAAAWERQHGRH